MTSTTSELSDSDIQEAIREAEDLVPLTKADLPLLPMSWFLIVEPMLPKAVSKGGIIIHSSARKVEQIQNTVGRVLAIGAQAFKGTTASGITLSNDPLVAEITEGTYVLFARYTGQEVKIVKDGRDRTIIILSDTELLAIVRDPSVIRFWI